MHGWENARIIKGQEALCPDGLGRVIDWKIDDATDKILWIQVRTYVDDRSCQWKPTDVQQFKPFDQAAVAQETLDCLKPTLRHYVQDLFHAVRNQQLQEERDRNLQKLSRPRKAFNEAQQKAFYGSDPFDLG